MNTMKALVAALAATVACTTAMAQTETTVVTTADSTITAPTTQDADSPFSSWDNDDWNTVRQNLSATKQKATLTDDQQEIWSHKKFMKIAYSWQNITPEHGEKLTGKMGFSLMRGTTIYLHKEPIENMLKFGIDWGGVTSYTKYEAKDETDKVGLHQIDVGLAVGPSITVNPIEKLTVKAFFYFVPSYTMMLVDDDFYSGFAPMFDYGLEVGWGTFALGIAGHSGSAKYNSMNSKFNNIMAAAENLVLGTGEEAPKKTKFSTGAFQLYVAFHF